MGNLIDSYRPDLSAEFDAQSRVVEQGTRNNTVTLTVLDSTTGSPISGVAAVCGTKTATGSSAGIIVFESIRTGNQTFIVSATGYATATVLVKVIRSKNTEAVVRLGK